jgi:hypothetical protein
MMPGEPILHPRGIKQESFLVETRSLGGYSGSPVFTFQHHPPRGSLLISGNPELKMPDFLIGVDWGHLPITEPVRDKDGVPRTEGWRVESNSGQMAVVPAWKLREMLESDGFKAVRALSDEAVRLLAERQKADPISTDK